MTLYKLKPLLYQATYLAKLFFPVHYAQLQSAFSCLKNYNYKSTFPKNVTLQF